MALLLGLVWSLPVAAQRLHTIELRQRPAAEVIPLIQPFLRPGDGISGSGFKLFVRTDEDTLAQLRQMLDSLDQAAQSLMISVRRGHQRSGYDRHLGARGAAVIHDGGVDGAVAVHGRDRYGQRSGGELQRVRAIAGEPAFIQTGLQVNRPDYRRYIGPEGTVVRRSYSTQDLTSGLYATVQMQGNDRVRIELSSEDRHPRPQRYGRIGAAVQNVSTVVSGRLGEWIEIGGVNRSWSGSSSGLASAGAAAGGSDDPVYIKVDRVE